MRKLIKQILKEEERNISVLKNYFINTWEKQLNSGNSPRIPNIVDLERKRLYNFITEINSWYLEFVGGEENATSMLDKYLDGLTVTEDDLKKMGFSIHPYDKFKIKITGVIDYKYRDYGNTLGFGFYIIDGNFETSDGQLTYEELMDEHYDDIYHDVTNWLRGELEGYVYEICLSFGLDFTRVDSTWDD